MPVLFKLVAVCDVCNKRKEYEAPVHHKGEPGADSMMGSSSLRARDVEHECPSPEDWAWAMKDYSIKLLCPDC